MKTTLYIVVYDDRECLVLPMGWEEECEGALCSSGGPIAFFNSRREALKAISISSKFAALRKAQGKPHNTDFTEGKSNLYIRPCTTKN